MEKLGRPAPAADDLRWCIGPPLKLAFATLLDTDDEAAMDEGVRLYRERYSTIGKFENSLIPGIPETLAAFVDQGYFLSVATSKLKTYAGDIIDHFDLRRYFTSCMAPSLTGATRRRATSSATSLPPSGSTATNTVMIGDRSHDIAAPTRTAWHRSACSGAMATWPSSQPPARRGLRNGRPSCRISSTRFCTPATCVHPAGGRGQTVFDGREQVTE